MNELKAKRRGSGPRRTRRARRRIGGFIMSILFPFSSLHLCPNIHYTKKDDEEFYKLSITSQFPKI